MPGYIQFSNPVPAPKPTIITKVPANRFTRMFSDNTVYYKPHSQYTGVGTVRNASQVGKKT